MCLYTKYIKNPRYRPNKKNGFKPQECSDERLMYVPVSCGRCIECRKKKRREWQVRLSEEIKEDSKCMFVTLTFSDENLKRIGKIIFNRQANSDEEENEMATKAVRMWLERVRGTRGKSIKHWLITEKGEDFARIHLHGIVWAEPWVLEKWQYGYVSHGTFVNEKTINYITKYVTKVNEKAPKFIGKILCSKGLGSGYIKTNRGKRYKGTETDESYKTRTGITLALPEYYRRNIFTDEEREKLWIQKQEQGFRYICGERVSTDNIEEWENLTRYYQERAKRLYGDDEIEWERDKAKKRLERMKIARSKFAVNKSRKAVEKCNNSVNNSVNKLLKNK